ncbi:MAG: hypothetical protein LQ341_002979 [Variospora aurantia]|nr:MAG: hypothetical protein LQ341_002979 [Variospora aurantia]
MSFRQGTSKNPFGPLQECEADDAMHLQQELPSQTDDGMPQTEAAEFIESILGPIERKRPAQQELPIRPKPKFSLAEAERLTVAAEKRAAARAQSVATSTAATSAQGTLIAQQGGAPVVSAAPVAKLLSLHGLSRKPPWQRCALSFDFDRTIGGAAISPIDWVASVRFDAAHFGNPKIILEICVWKVPTEEPLVTKPVSLLRSSTSYLKSYNFTNFSGTMELHFLQEESLTDNQKNLDQL